MAITNWAQVGAAAHEGDMDRARLALEAARVRQSAQAQRFDQQRTMALDAEGRAASERAYRDQREDLAYNRKQAERAYNDQRADLAYNRQRNAEQEAYNRGRQERVDALALDRERRLNEASQFDRMLKEEEAERRRTLWERDNAEYEKIQQQEQERKLRLESSFAGLVSAGFKYGDEVRPGMYCVPPAHIQKFNELTGQQLGGLVIATRDGTGKALATPQLMALEPLMDNQGKQVLGGADGKTPQVQLTPLPEAFTRGMFAAYPGVADAAGRFPESETWMQAMGIAPREQVAARGNTQTATGGTSVAQSNANDKAYLDWMNDKIKTLNEQVKAEQGMVSPNPEEVARLKGEIAKLQEEVDARFGWGRQAVAGPTTADAPEARKAPKFAWTPPQ